MAMGINTCGGMPLKQDTRGLSWPELARMFPKSVYRLAYAGGCTATFRMLNFSLSACRRAGVPRVRRRCLEMTLERVGFY